MKTASELISFLVKDKHFSLCSVCELHKPCATTPGVLGSLLNDS